MVLKLYGFPLSTCAQRVAVLLHEKRVPFEFVPVDYQQAEHKSGKYKEKQPFGEVPYIDDDGLVLYESRAVARYIQAEYADQGHGACACALRRESEQANLDPLASKAGIENVFKKWMGGTPDPNVFDALIEQLDAKLDVFDGILGRQGYVAGNEITLADLFFLPWGAMLAIAGSDVMTRKPKVDRWFKELSARPSWVAVKDGVQSAAF